jgi:hypothetical protein
MNAPDVEREGFAELSWSAVSLTVLTMCEARNETGH